MRFSFRRWIQKRVNRLHLVRWRKKQPLGSKPADGLHFFGQVDLLSRIPSPRVRERKTREAILSLLNNSEVARTMNRWMDDSAPRSRKKLLQHFQSIPLEKREREIYFIKREILSTMDKIYSLGTQTRTISKDIAKKYPDRKEWAESQHEIIEQHLASILKNASSLIDVLTDIRMS